MTTPTIVRSAGPDPIRAKRQRLLYAIDGAAVAPQVTADDWPSARAWVTLLALRGDGEICRARTADLVDHLIESGFRSGEVVQGLSAALALGIVSLHYGAADGLDVWAIDWDRVAELACYKRGTA
ncbi:hypothetical protein [Botrimarina mediterranea]|uniref:Uncharacterized protein n=1 Tax=Botrimarina mediterranea TaxID=2528022 RepID=A0A518K925_9BACT|nr:hypothetical protein [Botrimarina mediterranea]QDV74277.1 hypothetical protein Spa11_24780 [Botrimarina mediterranea]